MQISETVLVLILGTFLGAAFALNENGDVPEAQLKCKLETNPYDRRHQYDCYNQNMTDILSLKDSIPLTAFKTEISISYRKNHIKLIPSNLYSELLLNASAEGKETPACITNLNLRANQISEIQMGAFDNEPGCIVSLILSENEFKALPLKQLESLTNLRKLNLGYNNFQKIAAFSFIKFPKLEYLSLKSCNIEHLEPNSFSGLKELTELDIGRNLFTHIEPLTFVGLPKIKTLALSVMPKLQVTFESFEGITTNPDITMHTFLNMTGQHYENGIPVGPLKVSEKDVRPHESGEIPRCMGIQYASAPLSAWRANNFSNKNLPKTPTNPFNNFRGIGCFGHTDLPQIIVTALKDQNYTLIFPQCEFETVPNNLFTQRFVQKIINESGGETITPMTVTSLIFEKSHVRHIEDNAFVGDNGVMQVLILDHNNLTEINAKALEPLTGVRYLDISKNHIPVIRGGSFKNMKSLATLNLAHAGISEIQPNAFVGLGKLKDLQLQRNKLKVIPVEAFKDLVNVTGINLEANQFTNIKANSFEYMKSLERLDLSHCGIKFIEPMAFEGLTALQTLQLNDNDLKEIPLDGFESLESIRKIDLSHNDIHVIREQSFRFMLTGPELKVDLSNCNIKTIEPMAFSGLFNLTTLDLSGNQIPRHENEYLGLLESTKVNYDPKL